MIEQRHSFSCIKDAGHALCRRLFSINFKKPFIASFAILLISAITAKAWLRPSFEDAIVVERSELIVVGHLKEKSIEYVPHDSKPPEGKSWEHHATLVITECIKGKSSGKEIPVIIHYGLDPVVGGYLKRDGDLMIDARNGKKDYPTNQVQIFDTGNSIHDFAPVVDDAGKDNVWFLRRGSGVYGLEPGTNDLGIVDPDDVQPLQLKGYFETYLTKNPEDAVKTYSAAHPEISQRAQRFLNHLEIQRILRIQDPTIRFENLLPHYINGESWDMHSEIRQGIISCGKIAGERLVSVFQDADHKDLRPAIILIWRDMNYTESAPLLIHLLEDHDRFWAEQKLTNGWWSAAVGSELTRKRQELYGEVYYSVCALRTFRDPKSKKALELTQKRWESIKFDNPQILQECDAALKDLAGLGF